MDVSVIIVNCNTLELTENTIKKTKGIKYEAITVNNNYCSKTIKYFEVKL
ncbi:hypothetical protein LIY46_12095 [Fusobacterium varium]